MCKTADHYNYMYVYNVGEVSGPEAVPASAGWNGLASRSCQLLVFTCMTLCVYMHFYL